jgi:hypothetical protein
VALIVLPQRFAVKKKDGRNQADEINRQLRQLIQQLDRLALHFNRLLVSQATAPQTLKKEFLRLRRLAAKVSSHWQPEKILTANRTLNLQKRRRSGKNR